MNGNPPQFDPSFFRSSIIALMMLVSLPGTFSITVDAQISQSSSYDHSSQDHQPNSRSIVATNLQHSNISCSGDGSPVIVLLGGYGGGISDWQKVQPELAMNNQVCSYDRLVSQIDGSDGIPATAAAATDELRSLLELANADSGVVLVGFSIGGLLARHFQAVHPELVSGIVLIDPTPPEWPALRIGGSSVRVRQDLVITLSGMDAREPERIDILEVGSAVMASTRPNSPVVMLTAGLRFGHPGLYGDIQNALLNRLQSDQEQDLSAVRVEAPLCSHQLPMECHAEVVKAVRMMLTMVEDKTVGSDGPGQMPFDMAPASRRYRIAHRLKFELSFKERVWSRCPGRLSCVGPCAGDVLDLQLFSHQLKPA